MKRGTTRMAIHCGEMGDRTNAAAFVELGLYQRRDGA